MFLKLSRSKTSIFTTKKRKAMLKYWSSYTLLPDHWWCTTVPSQTSTYFPEKNSFTEGRNGPALRRKICRISQTIWLQKFWHKIAVLIRKVLWPFESDSTSRLQRTTALLNKTVKHCPLEFDLYCLFTLHDACFLNSYD